MESEVVFLHRVAVCICIYQNVTTTNSRRPSYYFGIRYISTGPRAFIVIRFDGLSRLQFEMSRNVKISRVLEVSFGSLIIAAV